MRYVRGLLHKSRPPSIVHFDLYIERRKREEDAQRCQSQQSESLVIFPLLSGMYPSSLLLEPRPASSQRTDFRHSRSLSQCCSR